MTTANDKGKQKCDRINEGDQVFMMLIGWEDTDISHKASQYETQMTPHCIFNICMNMYMSVGCL